MAIAALVLSLIFCFPLAPLVAVVLAIVVLARGRGADSGRGMAIAALVIAPLAMLPTVVMFAQGFYEGWRGPAAPRSENHTVTTRSEIAIGNLEVGDCVLEMQYIEEIEGGEAPTGLITVIPCQRPHKSEVFHIYELESGDFTRQRQLDRVAVEGCLAAFEDYVGTAYGESTLELHFYSPTVGQGPLASDEVTCLASVRKGLSDQMLENSRQ